MKQDGPPSATRSRDDGTSNSGEFSTSHGLDATWMSNGTEAALAANSPPEASSYFQNRHHSDSLTVRATSCKEIARTQHQLRTQPMHTDQLPQITIGSLLKLEQQIKNKRQRAKHDGIAFTMTHEEALQLALSSPHWQNIGPHRGQYHFCRRNHELGYTPENTFIGLAQDNVRERNDRCGNPNPKIYSSKAEYRKANPEKCKKASRKWREKHRIADNKNKAAYRKANPEKIRLIQQRKYQKKKAAAALQATAANSNQKPSEKRTLQLPFES
jgi:hypothetical protein